MIILVPRIFSISCEWQQAKITSLNHCERVVSENMHTPLIAAKLKIK